MLFFKVVCAVIVRALFLLLSLIAVWRVTRVKDDWRYWLLTALNIPLLMETTVMLKRRKGQEYKRFSPVILIFLISIIPSIWVLELHHQENKSMEQCIELDSWEHVLRLMKSFNTTADNSTVKAIERQLSFICLKDWILALHQGLLILLIIGKWLLPLEGGLTRDQLSQLLLLFVGTAADILEFTSETMSDVKGNSQLLVYIILGVWTWSMLQFPLHLAVVPSMLEEEQKEEEEEEESGYIGKVLLKRHSTDVWNIVESIFIQDGPFLIIRVVVITYFHIFHQMLVFFTIKNLLVVVLNLYRLVVICLDRRPSPTPLRRDY